MQETIQSPTVTHGPGPGSGIFDESDPVVGHATVASGVYAERVPVAGLTVRQVRERFADRLDIDPASQAVLGGAPVEDDAVVQEGQILTFVRAAGEKGRGTGWMSPAELAKPA